MSLCYYNLLEKRFDELTPNWIVPTGLLINKFANKDRPKWNLAIDFKGKVVRKASPIKIEDGSYAWKIVDAKVGIPDFVILNSDQYTRYRSMIERLYRGERCIDPFRYLQCKSGYYIEIFGERYHTGEFVRGLSKEEHEKEVMDAYAAAGASLLILWENDVNERWEEVCIPKINNFIKQLPQEFDKNNWTKKDVDMKALSNNTIESLNDTLFWRNLKEKDQNEVVDELVESYSKLDFPYPDINMALYDYKRFIRWSKNESKKGTRFGKDCCSYFVKSIAHAFVKNQKSKYDLWHDQEIMRAAIVWQLTNENGSHHANRFLSAMSFKNKFRAISNLSPSRVVQWCRTYGEINKGGVFYDPCAGWGGRMLAAHALNMKYVAIDANKVLVAELNEMARVLKIDAKVYHGDSSNKKFVDEILKGVTVDLLFTSPPYFDLEIYSKDAEQSIKIYPNKKDWYNKFASKIVSNAIDYFGEGAQGILNVPNNYDVECVVSNNSKCQFKDLEVLLESAKGNIKERLIVFKLGSYEKALDQDIENEDHVVCQLCHKRFRRIGRHLRSHHNIEKEEYLDKFPDSLLICKKDSDRVAIENKAKGTGRTYKQRVVYRIPDGSIVKKKDAWIKAWGINNPPEDSIIDASTVNLDPWRDKVEGIDFVTCQICGFKAKNLSRHVRREHNIKEYIHPLKSENCKKSLSDAANKSWESKRNLKLI